MTNDNRKTGSQPTSAGLLADRRAVSELLGAVLFFALLVLLLVLAQVSLVPALNQQVEYEHSQRVSDDVGDFETDLFRVASTGAPASTNFELGVTYPNRPLLINPAPVQGNLRSIDNGNVVLSGVTTDNPETADYWTGTVDRSYSTRAVEYSAPYNEYRNAGNILYENSVTYRQFPNLGDRTVVADSEAPLVEGNRITLVTIEGDLLETGQRAETIPISPISAPSQAIAVKSVDSSTPITITAQTRLDDEQWEDLIGDEPNVQDVVVDEAADTLTVTLAPGSYRLRMAHVGLGEGFDRTDPAYVTREPGFTSVVPTSGGDVSVQVRDEYNNPVDDAEVTFTITAGAANADLAVPGGPSGTDQVTVRTDENGLATVDLSGNDADVTLEAVGEFDGTGGTAEYERVEFGVQIGGGTPTAGGGDAPFDGINPNQPGRLVLEDVYVTCDSNNCGNDGTSRLVTVFDNRVGQEVQIENIRINAYQANAPGASKEDFPDFARVLYPGNNTVIQPSNDDITIDVRGPPVPEIGSLPVTTVPAGENSYELRLKLYVDDGDGTWEETQDSAHIMPAGDTMLVTLRYSFENTTSADPNDRIYVTSTYLLTPYHNDSATRLRAGFDTTSAPELSSGLDGHSPSITLQADVRR